MPIQTLRDIGEYLIDIHGQHAHQSLSRSHTQREILDQVGELTPLLQQVETTYREWKQVSQQLQGLNPAGEDSEARLSLLKYQVDELNQLDMGDNEFE